MSRFPLPGNETEGPLAEFTALREEIQERFRAQQNLLSLQLTISATVFGFAVSSDRVALLLIVPFSSYLLCGRLVAQHFGTLKVGRYITEQLSSRVAGGLQWEQWLGTRQRRPHLIGSTLPLLLTFAGVSLLALLWTVGFVFLSDDAVLLRLALGALWVLGLSGTIISTILVLQVAGKLPPWGWDAANLS